MDLVQLQSQIEFGFRVLFLATIVFVLKKFLIQIFFFCDYQKEIFNERWENTQNIEFAFSGY